MCTIYLICVILSALCTIACIFLIINRLAGVYNGEFCLHYHLLLSALPLAFYGIGGAKIWLLRQKIRSPYIVKCRWRNRFVRVCEMNRLSVWYNKCVSEPICI